VLQCIISAEPTVGKEACKILSRTGCKGLVQP